MLVLLQVFQTHFYYRRYFTRTVLINVSRIHLSLSQFILSPAQFFLLKSKDTSKFRLILYFIMNIVNFEHQQQQTANKMLFFHPFNISFVIDAKRFTVLSKFCDRVNRARTTADRSQ